MWGHYVITEYSIIMTIISCSLLIVILYFLRNKTKIIDKCNFTSIVMIYFLCIFRIFVPLEFPFSRGLYITFLANPIYLFLSFPIYFFDNHVIYVWEVLVFIWLTGGIVLFVSGMVKYYKGYKELLCIPRYDSDINREILKKYYSGKRIQIYETCALNGPVSYGLIRPQILIPKVDCTIREREMIIIHELAHHRNKDLFFRFMIDVLLCVFWWNPLSYLLKKDLDQIFELRADQFVIKNIEEQERIQYLKLLLRMYRENSVSTDSLCAALVEGNSMQLEERFISIRNSCIKKRNIDSAIIIVVTLILLFLSYVFVICPLYEPEKEDFDNEIVIDESTISIHNNEIYLITQDGTKIELQKEDLEIMKEIEGEEKIEKIIKRY